MNELGGLRVHAITRTIITTLASLRGNAAVRPHFSRLQQIVTLWTLEKLLPDVYDVRFPRPVLSLADVRSVLKCRCDFPPAAVDALAVDRL